MGLRKYSVHPRNSPCSWVKTTSTIETARGSMKRPVGKLRVCTNLFFHLPHPPHLFPTVISHSLTHTHTPTHIHSNTQTTTHSHTLTLTPTHPPPISPIHNPNTSSSSLSPSSKAFPFPASLLDCLGIPLFLQNLVNHDSEP